MGHLTTPCISKNMLKAGSWGRACGRWFPCRHHFGLAEPCLPAFRLQGWAGGTTSRQGAPALRSSRRACFGRPSAHGSTRLPVSFSFSSPPLLFTSPSLPLPSSYSLPFPGVYLQYLRCLKSVSPQDHVWCLQVMECHMPQGISKSLRHSLRI